MTDPKERAEELLETWINGNRKDVMRSLGQMSQMRAAYTASWITVALPDEGVQDFLRMMERRLDG